MRYLLALVFPPLAVLTCGKLLQALLNCFLCLFFIVPGVIHALVVVASYEADQRTQRVIAAMQHRG